MAPKKITVEGVGGVILSSDASLEKWLGKKGRECLLKEEAEIVDFESLEDGGTYTLGPPVIQQQQQQLELHELSAVKNFVRERQEEKAQGRPPLHPNDGDELRRDVRHLIAMVGQTFMVGNVQPTESAATRGEHLLDDLKGTGNYREHPLDPSEPSVMSTTELSALREKVAGYTRSSSTLGESVLTALLSPHVMAAIDETASGLVLSNTESHRWLPAAPNEATKNRRKPDLFTAHPLRISPAQAFGGRDIVEFRETMGISGLTFGGLDMKRDAENYITSMWEGKVNLGNLHVALGEMADYVRCWGIQKRNVVIILYDVNGFVVGDCTKSVIRTLYKLVPWDTPGSKAFLKTSMTKFVTPQILQAQKALVELQLRVENLDESPYLGSGSYGDVFRVTKGCDQVVALKVPRSTKSTFCKEYRMLAAAWKGGAPVVQVLAKVESARCTAYTMTPVGRTLPKTMVTCRLLFAALKQLHNSGWYHGDARYPNAIETPEKTILWIDFLNASTHDGDPAALVQDKITLGLSCVGELSAEDETTLTENMYNVHDLDDDSYAESFAIVSRLHEKIG